jgi:hypothetical protein
MKIGAVPESPLERLLLAAGAVPTPLVETMGAMLLARTLRSMSPARERVSGGRNANPISATDGRREAAARGPAEPPLCGGDITRFLEPEQSARPGSRLDV